jgi:hypothetical protein
VERSGVPTPVMDGLKKYFDPGVPPLPEGSAEIPLDWRFLWIPAAVLLAALAGILLLRLL